MALVFIRTTIIFIILFIVMRLMGKRQIGEMQPYELVITLIIAELACIPMEDNSIPLMYGVIAILAVYFLHQLLCLINLALPCMNGVLNGSPSIVLNKNGIDESQLKKNNLGVSDLIESLRTQGFFALDAVDYALYEAEGKFSALPKKGYESMQSSLPVVVVEEGKFNRKNLQLIGKDEHYFLSVLREQGCDEVQKTLILTVDGNGKAYFQKEGERYKVFQLDWEKSLW